MMSRRNLLPTDNDIITVGDFTRQVKDLLEGNLPACWIRGEISNLRRQSSGHIYFTLKDSESQLACVLFRGDAMRQTIELRDGMQVVVYGQISVYEPRGNYQVICRFVLEDGLGRLQQEFERLKQKLYAEGLFDKARKQALPLLPQVVGFVTSPTGAAIRDFVSILRRREWRGRLVVLPAKVQGVGAADEIVSMVQAAERMDCFDLLVVGRGGGSLEDLWPFNEEAVARAIASCPIPLISAVGHEIDFSLSDFAADIRAETPSAAAELISSSYIETSARVEDAEVALSEVAEVFLREHKTEIELLAQRLSALSPKNRIEQAHLKLDDMSNRLEASVAHRLVELDAQLLATAHRLSEVSPRQQISFFKQELQHLAARLLSLRHVAFEERRRELVHIGKRLENVSLQKVMRRGFAIVRDANGQLVTRKKDVKLGDKLSNDFQDGEIEVTVTNR